MNVGNCRLQRIRPQAGFTLLEVSSAMSVLLVLGVAVVILLQQHLQFLDVFRRQSFLSVEAPTVGNLLTRMLNHADHYFVFATKDDALSGSQPVTTTGKAVRLYFKSAAQETTERLLVSEPVSGGSALRFYTVQPDGSTTSWVVTNRIRDADFVSSEGILNITLRGKNGEEVTYGGGVR